MKKHTIKNEGKMPNSLDIFFKIQDKIEKSLRKELDKLFPRIHHPAEAIQSFANGVNYWITDEEHKVLIAEIARLRATLSIREEAKIYKMSKKKPIKDLIKAKIIDIKTNGDILEMTFEDENKRQFKDYIKNKELNK